MTIHVQQKTSNDCMLACIAMAAGKTWEEVWDQTWLDRVCKAQGASDEFTKEALEHAGFHPYVNGDVGKIVWTINVWNHFSREDFLQRLLSGRRAIISVPSLNHYGGWHVVFWDGHKLFDPNKGVEGKQYYRWLDHLAPRKLWIFDETKVDASV